MTDLTNLMQTIGSAYIKVKLDVSNFIGKCAKEFEQLKENAYDNKTMTTAEISDKRKKLKTIITQYEHEKIVEVANKSSTNNFISFFTHKVLEYCSHQGMQTIVRINKACWFHSRLRTDKTFKLVQFINEKKYREHIKEKTTTT